MGDETIVACIYEVLLISTVCKWHACMRSCYDVLRMMRPLSPLDHSLRILTTLHAAPTVTGAACQQCQAGQCGAGRIGISHGGGRDAGGAWHQGESREMDCGHLLFG